ncbi:MAG: hypothetical protein LBE20_06050 [Deltaproteobacteria bacterium]|jgi:hypothetical protein|nr:hypothetical protein [Deltaproteobacteria bacterium]
MKKLFIFIGLFGFLISNSFGEGLAPDLTMDASQAQLFKQKFTQDYLLILNPLIGTANSQIDLSKLKAPTEGSVQDVSGEWGIFGLFTTSHFDFSNFFFSSEVDGAYRLDLTKLTGIPNLKVPVSEAFEIKGNIFSVNAYLDKKAFVTPNVGLSYFYHRVRGDYTQVTVKEPMFKFGLRFNVKDLNLIFNPYLAYAWERTKVDINYQDKNIGARTSNDSLIYGFSAKYRWQMIHSEFRYSYQDSLVGKKGIDSVSAQLGIFLNSWAGFSAYFHYRDGIVCQEKSFLFGPVFVF